MKLLKLLASLFLIGLTGAIALGQSVDKANRSIDGGTVVGRVVAQGKPLAGATVALWRQPGADPINVVATGSTNNDGDYKISGVPAGNYFISARANGFITGKENQIFANLRYVNAIMRGKTERVNFELVPEGVISGLVTDAEGKPIAQIPINIFTEIEPAGAGPPAYARDLRTDAHGQYRIAGLPAANYRVAAGYYPVVRATVLGRPGYRRTFYGGVAEEFQALPIGVAPGEEITDVNINVGSATKVFSVTTRMVDSLSGKGISNLTCDLEAFAKGSRIGLTTVPTRSDENGEITIEGMPPGEYVIRVPGGSSIVPKDEVQPAPNAFGISKQFEVADKDVAVEVPIALGATLSGAVVVEGAIPPDVLAKVPQMRLVATVVMVPITYAAIATDGSFSFTGLKPGIVQFNFMGPPLPVHFLGIERDGVRLSRNLQLRGDDQITGVRFIIAYAASGIHGVVQLDGGSLPQGITGVASVLQKGKLIEGVRGELRDDGEFLLQNLPAGEYTLAVSVRDPNNNYWRTEQQITLSDDRVSEATVVLKSKRSNH